MLRPWRQALIWINFLNILASVFAVLSIVAAIPLLEMVFIPQYSEQQQINVQELDHPGLDKEEDAVGWFTVKRKHIERYIQGKKDILYSRLSQDPVKNLYYLVSVIVVAAMVRIILLSLSNWMMAKVETQFIQRLTYDLYRHIIYHDRIFFTHFPLGKLLSRISLDMLKLRTLIELVYVSKIQYPVLAVMLFITLLIVSPKLALFNLVVFPAVIIPSIFLSKTVKKLAGREVAFDAGLMEILEEQFSGQQLIKSLNGEKIEELRFEQ